MQAELRAEWGRAGKLGELSPPGSACGAGEGLRPRGLTNRAPVSFQAGQGEQPGYASSHGVGCHPLLQGIFSSRGRTLISYVSCIGRRVVFTTRAPGKPIPGLTLPIKMPKAMGTITSMLRTRKLRLNGGRFHCDRKTLDQQ